MSYNNDFGFFYNVRQTVYKWWCVVYKPAYKLFHHGYWPNEKEPYYQANQAKVAQQEAEKLAQAATTDAQDLADKILSSKQGNVDALVANTPVKTKPSEAPNEPEAEPEIDLSQVDPDALARANEIMARLASEAAADEAKKQAEIDAAKAKAREDEEAAKAKAKADEDAAKARADEIMARLASEAAADEAKKQAEIDAAKAKADEDARLASILKSTKVDISAFIEEGKAQRQNN
ncbi:MAG: hypothetical protein IKJ73_10170 [Lachnospiraceae bacterium]|nr:hypothetical protein [Lachnospiraceae bacterium]